jgi:hypothetical protein
MSGIVGLTMLAAAFVTSGAALASDADAMKELAPGGTLVVGVVEAPIAGGLS